MKYCNIPRDQIDIIFSNLPILQELDIQKLEEVINSNYNCDIKIPIERIIEFLKIDIK